MVKIAASILAADFARLGEEVRAAEAAGADYIHVDVMDGQFVPNISVGLPVVQALRRVTSLPLDVHLMIEGPERYLERFAEAGANILTVQQEACVHLHRVVQAIREHGVRPGVAINPATSLSTIEEILEYVDLVLVMTVNPGFGGQEFIPGTLSKIARLRRTLHERHLSVEIEVDGGINPETAPQVVRAGANVLVAGTSVFNEMNTVAENIAALRRAAARARLREA